MEISLRNHADVLAAIARASSVALSAYVLSAQSPLVRALTDAADRGARIAVTLDGAPYFGAAGPTDSPNPNLACAQTLRAHGATVELSASADPPVHLKAAVIDGRGFLDDRNWPASGRDTVVETDDPMAVDAIGDAIAGKPRDSNDFALRKAAALELEAATIGSAGDRIDVATESFGASALAAALGERARAGAAVRLEINANVLAGDVSGREHRALAKLAAAGVAIRAVGAAEKFAVSAGQVWLGSANATAAGGEMLDWGVRSDDPRLAAALTRSFERSWSRGRTVAFDQAPKSSAAVAFVRATSSASSRPNSSATNAAVAAM